MSPTIVEQSMVVAGLPIHIFSLPDSECNSNRVAVLFLLHGRTRSAAAVSHLSKSLVRNSICNDENGDVLKLIVVSFVSIKKSLHDISDTLKDHRNHGARMVRRDLLPNRGNSNWYCRYLKYPIDPGTRTRKAKSTIQDMRKYSDFLQG